MYDVHTASEGSTFSLQNGSIIKWTKAERTISQLAVCQSDIKDASFSFSIVCPPKSQAYLMSAILE
ncbi:Uncharacterized protein APZ42_026595 [Daphnia magna]|uniref:Uncharacterized protein n=1 Tax=Daphnia magna TaxID=35525 RepID=A0A164S4F8_9CRUS|nr:Uncharacterized protein APZ42_026595 [Daphnia magna]